MVEKRMIKEAVIVAAGRGRRLMPLTKTTPKCLLSIGKETILDHQLTLLESIGIEKVILVTGFCSRAIEKHIEKRHSRVKIDICLNPG